MLSPRKNWLSGLFSGKKASRSKSARRRFLVRDAEGLETRVLLAAAPLTNVAYTQNFDSLVNSGSASATGGELTGTLDGWYFAESGTASNTTYTAGTGSANGGDTYSFGATSATDRAFGGLQSGSLIPTLGGQFINNNAGPITQLDVSYFGETWRTGTASRQDRLDFQYSLDATSLTTGTWIDVNTLDYSSPSTTAGTKDGNLAANRSQVTAAIS